MGEKPAKINNKGIRFPEHYYPTNDPGDFKELAENPRSHHQYSECEVR